MTMLSSALAHAKAGFYVFPVAPGAKVPLIEGWQTDATRDQFQIESWWDENPEANIGAVPNLSGHFVVDLDRKNGNDGVMALAAVAADRELPDTFAVTTPTGGAHLWFKGKARNSVSKIAPGVDVRGQGGYVLLPGSKIGGADYTTVADVPIADAPAWLTELAAAPREAPKSAPADIEIDAPANVSRARDWLSRRAPAIEGQGGNSHTFSTACGLRDLGLSEDAAFDLLNSEWNAGCVPPWPEDELWTIVRNAFAYAKNDAGADALSAKSTAEIFPDAIPGTDAIDAPSITTPSRGIIMRHLPDWRAQEPTRWLIDGFISDGETVLIHAPSGSFKSFIVGDLALAVASGIPAFGKLAINRTGPVVSFLGEGRKAFEQQRTEAWFKERRFTPSNGFQLATVQGVPLLADPSYVRACIDAIDTEFAGRQGGLIVIDPYTRAILGMKENDTDTASLAIQLAEELKERFGCTVIFVAHEGLDAGRARGSSALPAGFDSVWGVKRDAGSLAVEIRPVRLKDGPEDQSLFLQGRNVKAPIEGEQSGTLIFDLIGESEFRRTKTGGKAGGSRVTSTMIATALRQIASPLAIPTSVLAEQIATMNAGIKSINAARQQLERGARGDFAEFVPVQPMDGKTVRTWALSVEDWRAERA
jgi:hypothetical protein